MTVFVFTVLAVLAVVSALGLLLLRNPIHCALALVLVMACIAGFFLLLSAEFLAIMQVLIYAGAIMVLIMYLVMLLRLTGEAGRFGSITKRKQVGVILAVLLAVVFLGVVGMSTVPTGVATGSASIQQLSTALFTTYLFPFEVTSLLLLAAIAGAVTLATK